MVEVSSLEATAVVVSTTPIVSEHGDKSGSANAVVPRDILILTEQVQAIYRASYSVAGAHALVATLLFLGLHEPDNHVLISFWAIGMCLMVAAYIWSGYAFKRASPGPESSPIWARRRVILGWVAGVLWGGAGAFLFPAGDIAGQALLSLMLIGFAAGSLTSSASYLPANDALVIPMLVPFAIRTGMEGTKTGIIVGVLLAIYLGFILNGARNINRVLIESLRRRFENIDLISALTVEKAVAEHARQSAESANRAKSQFLAAASHDLRQPLHALGLFAAALEEKIRYPEVLSIVNNITASIAALEALFNELLDVSKLDAGVIVPAWVNFPLQPLFDRITVEYGPLAKEKNLTLTIMPTRVVLYSDPLLLERILHNLVSNAIRYTSSGRVVLGVRYCANHARLEIWDTGPGIPMDQQDKVFEEFYQVGNSERDRSKGLGLGLAIVRRLTQLLNHTLHLNSRVGKGSVFRVMVPIGKFDKIPEPIVIETEERDEHLSGKYILLMDDERAVREGMAALLTEWGCKITVVGSIQEGMQVVGAGGRVPDLIIADYRLREGVTGADAIRQLQGAYGGNIPGVLITGDTAPDRILEAKASGYYLLHKPVVPGRLRVFLNLMLRGEGR
ncbi:MAG: hybrid sensor histidine kinase/response regulator [Pseudomonadota bacterium]